jgi:hypothetical protein
MMVLMALATTMATAPLLLITGRSDQVEESEGQETSANLPGGATRTCVR